MEEDEVELNQKKGLTILIYLSCLVSFFPLSIDASSLNEINTKLHECIASRELIPCRQALVHLEVLQRMAAAKKKFPCQTNVLGLQAELLMMSKPGNDLEVSFPLIKEVNEACSDF